LEKDGFVDLGSRTWVPKGPLVLPPQGDKPRSHRRDRCGSAVRVWEQRLALWDAKTPIKCGEVSCISVGVHRGKQPQLMAFNNSALKY